MSHKEASRKVVEPSPSQDIRPALRASIDSALAWSIQDQSPEGYWVGKLETNSCMEAEWVLALHVMGLRDHPIRAGLIRSILNEQRDDGSWEIYTGAPAGDINTTVECYAALRSAGIEAADERLTRARGWIMARGGLKHVRVFTRYWLALIGEWPWTKAPNIPPEVVHFPLWFPLNIYNFSSWARATLMPIAVLSARRPVVPLDEGCRLDELFPEGREAFDYDLPKKAGLVSWERFFLTTDKILHRLQSAGLIPGRERTIRKVIDWIVDHQDADGVWGGIQPPWIYSLMALHGEGHDHSDPVMGKGLAALDDPRWVYERDGGTYVHASVSPVWDTVLTLLAIQDCEKDTAHAPAVEKALDWLLDQEVRTAGDWAQKMPDIAPGGWAFEYENASYPDVDDTAVVLIVLARYRDDPKWQAKDIEGAIQRGVGWMLAMQSSNGGWAAFDKDNDRMILTKIPFCDFGEALDPPSVDVTAHVLEALGILGYTKEHEAVRRGVDFLLREQEREGSWFGRWGVNFIYGTAAALPALKAVGEDMRAENIEGAANWTVARQNADGGWGESCGSYMTESLKGSGESAASQTGWALISLLAVGRPEDRTAIERGLQFLAERQEDGTWDEPEYTGTGFPGYGVGLRINLDRKGLEGDLHQSTELSRGFMINYNLYRHYFPLMAMGRAEKYLDRLSNQPT